MNRPPILFVHGMCHAAWCWEENFIPFFKRAGYACHAVNLTGHEKEGRTHRLKGVGMGDYVKDVACAVEALGVPPVLIGHSMGGRVVQQYLKTGKCEKAVLVASVPPGGVLRATFRLLFKHPGALGFLPQRDLLGIFSKYRLMFGGNFPSEKEEEVLSRMCGESFRAYLEMLSPLSGARQLRNYPILVVGGTADRIFSVREFTRTAKRFDAPLAIIENGSHDLMLDSDSESTAGLILNWLEGRSSSKIQI